MGKKFRRRSNLSKRKTRISKKRRMSGGGFVLRDPDISKYQGFNIGNTLTKDTVRSILDGTMDQLEVNKHLLTAIVTVYNYILNRQPITDNILGRLAVQEKFTDIIRQMSGTARPTPVRQAAIALAESKPVQREG